MTRDIISLSPALYLMVAGMIFAIGGSQRAFWISLVVLGTGLLLPHILNARSEDAGWAVLIVGVVLCVSAITGLAARAIRLASPPLSRGFATALGIVIIVVPPAWLLGRKLFR